ncbi:MAG: diaminopimelate epimerase [Clostridiales bacterium]
MRFAKMHGLGNDFVIINGFSEKISDDLSALAKSACHRQLGIGADGLIVLTPAEKGIAAVFNYYNADGSRAEMCGNGLRCAALFAKKEGIVDDNKFTLQTLGGLVQIVIEDEQKGIVSVDMGQPRLNPAEIPARFSGNPVIGAPLTVQEQIYSVTLVSMGNPHCVIFVENIADFPVDKVGAQIEIDEHFPAKTNVEFIQLLTKEKIAMRVWERGCGETLACGSGACAAVVASVLNGYTKNKVSVYLQHGVLQVEWAENRHVLMTGSATLVARGDYFVQIANNNS